MLGRAVLAAFLLAGSSFAATIAPSNSTITDTGAFINLTISVGDRAVLQSNVFPLSSRARDAQSTSQQGNVFAATTNNYLNITSSSVAFISCDNATTNIDALTIYGHAASVSPTGIIFYSITGDWCQPQPTDSLTYRYVYTMTNTNDTAMLLYGVINRQTASLATLGVLRRNSTDSPDPNTTPATGTALAMIILYAITGTITAMFILIIITGTIRAHRHPERYGPTTVDGRPKRTRAGGLARAMLDTLPVVKFGERTTPKPGDVELGVRAAGDEAGQAGQQSEARKDVAATTTTEETEGIAAASSSAVQTAETQGCSICTEDFEIGQDQRVLPCEHCFHPACIDPWLLNVSGTCPLCRVDLRAPEEEEETTATTEPGSATRPPAARRRSVLMAITGLRRPDGMSREERISALRRYRQTQQSEGVQAEPGATDPSPHAQPDAGEERRIRQRLRNLFDVRTRRTAPQS